MFYLYCCVHMLVIVRFVCTICSATLNIDRLLECSITYGLSTTIHYQQSWYFVIVQAIIKITLFQQQAFRLSFKSMCDRISHNKASTHTKSNLRFYQKWIAGLIHYHIPHCTSFKTGKSSFCSSFLLTLSKPRVGDWCH